MPQSFQEKLRQQIEEEKLRQELKRWSPSPFVETQPFSGTPAMPQFDLPQPDIPQWTPARNIAPSPSLMSQDVMTEQTLPWISPTTEQVYQKPEQSVQEAYIEPAPQLTKWYEKPKEIWGKAEEKIAEGISKVPILPEGLEKIAPAFEWIHEKLEKPFAAIITSPFAPDLPWKKGESWLDHKKREYSAWEAPTYVKGAAQFAMPLWWMPWFGWASRGAKALAVGNKAAAALAKTGKVATVAEKGLPASELLDNVLFRAGRLRSAMEHVPIVNRIVKAVGGEGAFITRKEALRISELAKAKVPLSPADALTKTKMELVKLGFISDMRNGVKSLLVPKLQVMGNMNKILGMDSKGIVSNIIDNTGKSQYLYDVLEQAIKERTVIDASKRTIIYVSGEAGKLAKQYVETLGSILDDVYKLARKEGVKVPKEIILHRIVKGKVYYKFDKTGKKILADVEESEYGSLFEKARVHELMKEGVEQVDNLGRPTPVQYGLDINESISSTIDHYIRNIARKRFTNEVGRLGKKPKDLWEAMPESVELYLLQTEGKEIISRSFINAWMQVPKSTKTKWLRYLDEPSSYAGKNWNELPDRLKISLEWNIRSSQYGKIVKGGKEAVLNQPERLKELILMKNDFINRFRGNKQILGENMARFSMHPVFKNAIFPKEVVKTAERIINDEGQAWLRQAATVSGTSRVSTAAMDLSAPFIQGAAVWGRNPLAWAKGVKNMLEYAVSPQRYYKYLTDPVVTATRMERVLYGGSSSTFEYYQALAGLQRQLRKIPIVGKGISKGVGETWGRAETAFTGFGEVARNEMWKALRRPNMTNDALMDLSRSIDRMTGVMSTEALAIGRTQQDFENAFVFFAPRYTRAGLAFTSDALRGGMTGAEARKAIGFLMAAGVAYYYGACKVLNQQPNFNPNSGRFMTIKVGESHVGVGGIMTALLRLAYDVGITVTEDPINLVKPLSEGHLNRWDNPFVKFLYSRTSPLTSVLTSTALEQTNYFGEPLESLGDWAGFLKDKITPIALQDVMRDPQAATMVAKFGGLRVFPKSPWELLDEERDKISIQEFRQPYENLNDLQQTQVDKFDTVRKLQTDVDAQTVTRGDEISVGFINRQRERDTARQVYEETLWNLQRAFDDGVIDGRQFREEMSNAGYGLGTTYDHIDSQPEYKDVLKKLQEPRVLKDKHTEDIAYAEFMDMLYKNNEFEDQYGLFQFDKYNQFIEQFRDKYGEDIYQYILDRKAERDNKLPPLAKEYQKAKEILKPYWEIQSKIETFFGKQYAESTWGKRMITKLRQQIRLANPELNKYYMMFYSIQ